VSARDTITLLPFIALTLSAVIVMLAGTFHHSHRLTVGLTLAGLVWTGAMLPITAARGGRQVTDLLLLDDYTLFFMGLLVLTTAGVVLISYGYLERREEHPHDYYTLLLLATLGGATLVASTHFASFFLGLEVLSVSLYTLIAYPRLRAGFIEAGVKYLVLAAVTAAFLLFGMALVYAELGTMSLNAFAHLHVTGGPAETSLLIGGFALIIVGIGFKLGVVPFHMWTPDVYQGAPAPVTAFVATVSKGAMVALLLRYFRQVSLSPHDTVWIIFAIIAAASMIAGNLLALLQTNVNRLLAYSSIAHLGYILVAFLAVGRTAAVAVGFYLVAYFVTTLGAFGIVSELSGAEGRDADRIDDYRGLAARRPLLAATFAVSLFSLAGIPLTAGFLGKFYVVTAGAGSRLWWLLIVLVASSTIGLYYYTRIVVAMYVLQPADDLSVSGLGASRTLAGSRAGDSVLVVVTGLILFLGIYPSPLIRLLEHVVAGLP
jgi:NADH-quinone oxidoreductase subunit N